MAKINIDFQILPTYDPKTIIVVDTSNWEQIESKPSIIEILLPGEITPITHYFDKNKVNVFNSQNLGLLCATCEDRDVFIDLPDGIYQFTVKGSPEKFTLKRDFLKTDLTQLELDKVILSFDLQCNDFSSEILNKIKKINLYLEAAESNTRLGYYCEAQDLLFKAQKMISKLKGCKVCV